MKHAVSLSLVSLGWVGSMLVGCAGVESASTQPSGSHNAAEIAAEIEDAEIQRLLHTDRPWLPSHPPEGSTDMAPFAACFDADNPPSAETIARVNQLIRGSLAKYNAVDRWTTTSINGAVASGQPITLRVSFVPDTVNAPDLNSAMAPSTLFASMDAKFGGNRTLWMSKIQQAFTRWSTVTGVNYVWVTAPGVDWDDGAAWGSGGSTTRGDVRIAMRALDGVNGVLAFNSYPNDGDMVLDSGESWQSSGNDYRFLRNVIMHEHGHGLGLAHVCPINSTKLLEPNYSGAFDGPQQDDLRGIHFRYGDINEPNNTAATATAMGNINAGQSVTIGTVPTPLINNGSTVSLTTDGDQDWYRFDPSTSMMVSATVTPLGTTYDAAQQSGSSCPTGSPVDALRQADIAVSIVASNGTTVLSTASGLGLGIAETDSSVLVTGSAPFYVKVFESGTATQSQMYRLNVTTAAGTTLAATDGTLFENIRVSWTAIDGAASYQLWRTETNNRVSALPIATITDTVFNDTEATPGQVYYYWLRSAQGSNPMVDVAGPEAGSSSPCKADIGRLGGLAGFDGALDNNDFIAFVNYYFAANLRADFGGPGGLANPDGVLNNNDFIAYIAAFFTGCP
ncbi:MAG: GC-type dockerin domain-anchored protein [Phycisphaerales bacterium]